MNDIKSNTLPQPLPRWTALVYYRSDVGLLEAKLHFEELCELDGIIERGPNWNTISQIKVVYNCSKNEMLTASDGEA